MPQGDKSAYTDKQKRKAEHIEEGYEDRGVSEKEAERRAWATVNKESGGGKKSGSGRGHADNHASSEKGWTQGRRGGGIENQGRAFRFRQKGGCDPKTQRAALPSLNWVRRHRQWRHYLEEVPHA